MMAATYAYVIGSQRGPHKVGLSRNPTRRLSQLQVGSPVALMLERSGPVSASDPDEVEAYAHWLLRESYVRGEWFKVTEEAAWVALIAAQEAVARRLGIPEGEHVGGGRKKPLKDVMPVRFVEGTLDRIDAVAGKFRRAEWIRGVVEDALAKAEKRKPGKGATEGEQT